MLSIIVIKSNTAQAQTDTLSKKDSLVEIELSVGDTVTLGDCKETYFEHINYFKKTRFPEFLPYDTATGNGFYRSFFSTGDFDSRQLSCSFKGKRFAILGLETLKDKKTGEDFTVLYLKGPEEHSVIWVDVAEASDKLEVLFER